MTSRCARSWYAIAPEDQAQPGVERALFGGRVTVTAADPTRVELDGRALPVCIRDGVVFAWFDPDDGPPTFELPRLNARGWTRSSVDTLTCAGQPESVMRDLADYAHFESTHGYIDPRPRRGFWSDGHACGLEVDFHWPIVSHRSWPTMVAAFSNRCAGLGYQVSDVRALGGRFRSRHRVLPTPIDDRRMQVVLGLEVRLALPLGRLIAPLIHPFVRTAFRRDVGDDMRLWARLPDAESDRGDEALDRYWAWADAFASDRARRESASA